MIVIFYNPNKDVFYAKIVKSAYWNQEYEVGYINQYNHEIVCMFYVTDNGKLVACRSIFDYFETTNISLKERLIKKIIKFLERRV